MIIDREEVQKIKELKPWILVYGRRKTGKTFLVRNFVKHDEYFFVKRSGEIITNDKNISYETFKEIFKRAIDQNKTVVVDEFHRLNDDFFDYLHYIEKKGKVILISSTLFLSKKLVDSKTPLFGIFAEFQVDILKLKEVIKEVKKKRLSKKEIVELSILFREPLLIKYYSKDKTAREIFKQCIETTKYLVPALIGEIFIEEDRKLSKVYETILKSVAQGKIISSDISSYLFSNKLIQKDDPSTIQQYLTNLIHFGILKRIKIYNKKYFIYKHTSPLVYMYYYMEEKYNFSEKRTEELNIKQIIDEIYPLLVEDNIREFLANHFGLTESKIDGSDYDVDAYLLKFKKPEIAIEVKWKKSISKKEILRAEEILNKHESKRKILFVPNKNEVKFKTSLEVLDIFDFV